MNVQSLMEKLSKLDPKLEVNIYIQEFEGESRMYPIDEISIDTYREEYEIETVECVLLTGIAEDGLAHGDGFNWDRDGDEEE